MTPETDILEAVARAICEAHLPAGTCDMGCESCKREARAALTAALDCMREPSDGIERAWKEVDAVRFDWGTAHEFHEATIDQLRKEALGDDMDAACKHDWMDARNEIIQDGEWCRKCGAIRAGNEVTEEQP